MGEKSIAVYLDYAPADHMYVHELKKHLAFLEKQELLTLWQDGDIYPGADFRKERLARLYNADVILIFVSPDFLESDSCFSAEMQQVMQRHVLGDTYVVPILLRPVHWQGVPFGHIQALPKNGVPISSERWSHLDEALFGVTQEIITVLQKLLGDRFKLRQPVGDPEVQPRETQQSQRKSQSQFDQRGQFVSGKQFNAGGDINFR